MTQIASYRYAIDNVEQTGNRSVVPESPLHYDRLTRCLDVASPTTEWRNAQLKFYNIQPNANLNPTQPTAYDQDNTTICETMTQTAGPKYLDLQIVTAGGGGVNDLNDILIYKQHLRSL
jgi:hypothetical protein